MYSVICDTVAIIGPNYVHCLHTYILNSILVILCTRRMRIILLTRKECKIVKWIWTAVHHGWGWIKDALNEDSVAANIKSV